MRKIALALFALGLFVAGLSGSAHWTWKDVALAVTPSPVPSCQFAGYANTGGLINTNIVCATPSAGPTATPLTITGSGNAVITTPTPGTVNVGVPTPKPSATGCGTITGSFPYTWDTTGCGSGNAVNLQTSSPGTPQTGNDNISGVRIAGTGYQVGVSGTDSYPAYTWGSSPGAFGQLGARSGTTSKGVECDLYMSANNGSGQSFCLDNSNGDASVTGSFWSTLYKSNAFSAANLPVCTTAASPDPGITTGCTSVFGVSKFIAGSCAASISGTACTFPNSWAFPDTNYNCSLGAQGSTPILTSFVITSTTEITVYSASATPTTSYTCEE